MELISGIIAAGLAGLGAVATALRWPMLAVCLFLVLTLSNAPGIMVNVHGLPSIGTLIVPALAGLLLTRAFAGQEDLSNAANVVIPALVLFVALALRAPWADDSAAANEKVIELAKNLVILLVLVGFLTNFDRLRTAVRTTSATIGGLAGLSVLQYLTNSFDNNFFGFANASLQHITGEQHGWRVSGPLPDPNFFAQLLVMALPLSIALAMTEPRWPLRVLAAVSGAAIASAILLTYSRGALLGLAILAAAYVIASRRRSILVPAALAALALAVVLMPPELFERVYSGIETGGVLQSDGHISGDPAVIERVSVMRAALRMFLDNPVFGVGPGQFAAIYESYALAHDLDMGAPPAAHNLYLEIAAEQGVSGLALFAAFIVTALVLTGRQVRRLESAGALKQAYLVQALGYAIVGYLATAIFLHDAFPRFFWTFFALVVASWWIATARPGDIVRQQRSSTMPADQLNSPATGKRRRLNPSLPKEALRRGLGYILLGALIAGGFATYQVAQTPARYTAEAKLLYRFGREYFPITPKEVRRNWGENIIVSLDNALATEMHLLTSYEVAVQAVDAVEGGFALPATDAADAPETKQQRVAAFSDLSGVRRVQGATMLSVTMEHTDPGMTDRMLDAFLAVYMQRRDALFHTDALAYFEDRMAALEAQDTAIQEQLGRLHTEYRALEDQASLTEWSPDQPVGEGSAEMREIQAKLAWMQGLIEQQGKRSTAVRDRMIELELERTDWEMSRAYTQQVAPVVEIADRTPVRKSGSRVQALIRILSAAIAGAFVLWGCVLLLIWAGRNGAEPRG